MFQNHKEKDRSQMKKNQFWISRDDGEATNVFFWTEEPIEEPGKGYVAGSQAYAIEDPETFKRLFGVEVAGGKFKVDVEIIEED